MITDKRCPLFQSGGWKTWKTVVAVLGMNAYELEVGVEFSIDEGCTWLTVYSIVEDPSSNDVIINARNDDGDVNTIRIDSMKHVLLNRNWKP